MPASDSTALIAGIVGAFVGAAIITGVIVGLVCRRRRRTQAGSEMNTARNDEEPSSSRTGMYQQLPLTANPLKEYSVGNVNPD